MCDWREVENLRMKEIALKKYAFTDTNFIKKCILQCVLVVQLWTLCSKKLIYLYFKN